jgi:hypothetical protein
MNMDGAGGNTLSRDMNRLQMTLVTQLYQAVATMNHIDELFQWLAYAIVQRFNIQLVQFWANQTNPAGRLTVQLRTLVSQDPSLPEQAVANDHIAYITQRVTSERRSYKPQSVETVFAPYQAALLKRYGMNYCGVCFASGNVLLPPSENILSYEKSPTHLAMTALLFVRYTPHPDIVPTIGVVLEKAISIAENHGLLLPIVQNTGFSSSPNIGFSSSPNISLPVTPNISLPVTPQPVQQEFAVPLEKLIPRRKQDADLMLSNNPFTSATVISDKNARRLHAAIDGHSNITDLCNITKMNMRDIYVALHKLLDQQRIELCDPDGRPVDLPAFR